MWLFAVFVAVPLIEIALFIQVGGWLTLWPTLAIVVLTAMLGTALMRREGLRALTDVQGALESARDPLTPLAHGALILFAGALLLTPGFLTDAVGFALLVPPVRGLVLRWLARRGMARMTVHRQHGHRGEPPRHPSGRAPRGGGRVDGEVIDAEFQDISDRGPSSRKPEPDRSEGAGQTGHRPARPGAARPPSGWTRH